MKPHAAAKKGTPLRELIDLLKVFGDAHDCAVELTSDVEHFPSLSTCDLNLIVSSQQAIVKALSENDYEMARLAYQVLDCTLRDAIEPTINMEMIIQQDDKVIWTCADGENVVTKADVINIANAINVIRLADKVGTPPKLEPGEADRVLDYARPALG